jgi:hypothetical protein
MSMTHGYAGEVDRRFLLGMEETECFGVHYFDENSWRIERAEDRATAHELASAHNLAMEALEKVGGNYTGRAEVLRSTDEGTVWEPDNHLEQ